MLKTILSLVSLLYLILGLGFFLNDNYLKACFWLVLSNYLAILVVYREIKDKY